MCPNSVVSGTRKAMLYMIISKDLKIKSGTAFKEIWECQGTAKHFLTLSNT